MKKILYNINPFIWLLIIEGGTIIYSLINNKDIINIACSTVGEFSAFLAILLLIGFATEGNSIKKGNNFKSEIGENQENHIYSISYYETKNGATFSAKFNVWLLKHFGRDINKNYLVYKVKKV